MPWAGKPIVKPTLRTQISLSAATRSFSAAPWLDLGIALSVSGIISS